MTTNNLTFSVINIDRFSDRPFLESVIYHLTVETNRCQNVAFGIPDAPIVNTATFGQDPLPEFVPTTNFDRMLVLVFEKSIFERLMVNNSSITDIPATDVVKYSVGHAYLVRGFEKNICGIWDVCLHEHYLSKTGYGSAFMSEINWACITHCPVNTIIWLGIDLRNVNFAKVFYIYVKIGFKKPVITFKDPFGHDLRNILPYGALGMIKPNYYIDVDKEKIDTITSEAGYILSEHARINSYLLEKNLACLRNVTNLVRYQIQLSENSDCSNACNLKLCFSKNAIKMMESIPRGMATVNQDGSLSPKEVSGSFVIQKPKLLDNTGFVWEVDLEHPKKFIFGTELNVNNRDLNDDTKYIFHSHATSAYKIYSTKIGPPSGPDLISYIDHVKNHKFVFNGIITTEGVYIVSLNCFWTLKSHIDWFKENITNDIVNNAVTRLDSLSAYYRSILDTNVDQSLIPNYMQNYIKDLNTMYIFSGLPPVFTWKLLNIKNLDACFSIFFPKNDNNVCVAPMKTKIDRIYK